MESSPGLLSSSTATPFCLPSKQVSIINGLHGIKQFSEEPTDLETAIYATTILLFVLGARVIFTKRAKQASEDISPMRWFIFWYAISTGIFATILAVWNAGKVLLIAAATHNLFEWGIIGYLLFPKETAQKWWTGSIFWIWLVISLVGIIPSVIYSFIFEQTFGLICDYLLFWIFAFLWFYRSETPELASLWRLGVVGAATHFGQIWALVVGSFGIGGIVPYVCEWFLIFSSLFTFFAYGEFALRFDEIATKAENADKKPNQKEDKAQNKIVSPYNQTPFLSTTRVVILLLVCGAFSFTTINGPIILFGVCPLAPLQIAPKPNDFCVTPTPITGFTVLKTKPGQEDAVQDFLETLIIPSRNETGNVFYNLFKGDDSKFAFVESWKSLDVLKQHIGSAHVRKVFDSPQFLSSIIQEDLFGPWLSIEPCYSKNPPTVHLAINGQILAKLNVIWDLVTNMNDCSWVMGCTQVKLISANQRKLIFGTTGVTLLEDITFNSNTHQVYYGLETPTPFYEDYHAIISFVEYQGATNISYVTTFKVPNTTDETTARNAISADLHKRLFEWLPTQFKDGKHVPH